MIDRLLSALWLMSEKASLPPDISEEHAREIMAAPAPRPLRFSDGAPERGPTEPAPWCIRCKVHRGSAVSSLCPVCADEAEDAEAEAGGRE